MKGSLTERQDSIVQNIDNRMNERANIKIGREYIKELFDNEDRRKKKLPNNKVQVKSGI